MMKRQIQNIGMLTTIVAVLGMGCSSSHHAVQDQSGNDNLQTNASKQTPSPVKQRARPIEQKRQERPRPSSTVMKLASDKDVDPPVFSVPQISLDEIRLHVENKTAVVLDARSPEDFNKGHVQGAINIPASQMEQYVQNELGDMDHDQFIIIYCQSAACHSSDVLYEYLLSRGFTNMRVYSPGWQILARARDIL